MKKFLFYTSVDLTSFSGERTHILNFIKYLPSFFNIFLVCSNINYQTEKEFARKDLKIIFPSHIKNIFIKKIITLSIFLKTVLKESPEIIYIRHSIFLFPFSYFLNFLKDSKKVVEVNGFLMEEFKTRNFPSVIIKILNFFEKKILEKADYVICVSQMIKESLLENYNIDSKKFFVCQNGVDLNLFRPIEKGIAFLKTKLNPNFDYIGYIGGLTEWQDLNIFIKVFSFLGGYPKLKLLIVGGGRKEKCLKEKVKEKKLEEKIFFMGNVSYKEIPYWISILKLGILPDIRIKNNLLLSSPLKLLEYLACGIPIMGFKSKELEILEKEGIDIIVSQNSHEIKEKILQFNVLNEKEKNEIKKKARSYAENYSWENTVKKVLNFINNKE